MPEKRECNTCGGTYERIQNGMIYFHTCPPVFNNVTKEYEKRPDHRDENVIVSQTESKGKIITTSLIKSEGKGFKIVSPP